MRRTLLVIIALLLLILGALGVAAADEELFFANRFLSASPFTEEEVDLPREQAVRFTTPDGEELAHLAVEVRPLAEGQRWLLVSLWHAPATQLDSLELRLETAEIEPAVSLLAPASWPPSPSRYYLTDGARTLVLELPALGVEGEGTVTREFVLGAAGDLPEQLRVEATFTMHEEGFPALVQWTGEGAVDVVVVGVGR